MVAPVGKVAANTRVNARSPHPPLPSYRFKNSGTDDVLLGQRQIQILNGLIDLSRILVADRNGIHAGVSEGELHRRLAVFTSR